MLHKILIKNTHVTKEKTVKMLIHSALGTGQGTCIPGNIRLSTLNILMSTYNSANLNKLHPEMGRHASHLLRIEHNEVRTGSNHNTI